MFILLEDVLFVSTDELLRGWAAVGQPHEHALRVTATSSLPSHNHHHHHSRSASGASSGTLSPGNDAQHLEPSHHPHHHDHHRSESGVGL
jgi:hypothetical protein